MSLCRHLGVDLMFPYVVSSVAPGRLSAWQHHYSSQKSAARSHARRETERDSWRGKPERESSNSEQKWRPIIPFVKGMKNVNLLSLLWITLSTPTLATKTETFIHPPSTNLALFTFLSWSDQNSVEDSQNLAELVIFLNVWTKAWR